MGTCLRCNVSPVDEFIQGLLVGAMIVVVLFGLILINMPSPPRLMGVGCAGSSGTLYANEEDHFPYPCTSIREYSED